MLLQMMMLSATLILGACGSSSIFSKVDSTPAKPDIKRQAVVSPMPGRYRQKCSVTPIKPGSDIRVVADKRGAEVKTCEQRRAGAVRHYDRVTR